MKHVRDIAKLWKINVVGRYSICLTIIAITCGCGKSRPKSAEDLAEQNALERHEKSVNEEIAARGLMNNLKGTEGGRLTADATRFMAGLYMGRRLPGNEGGVLSDHFNVHNSDATNYPVQRTFNVRLKAGGYVNHYTVVKPNKTDNWELVRAWKTDKKGETVAVFLGSSATNAPAEHE